MEKLIVTVAPTGSLPTNKTTPYVPILPEEIIKTGIKCEKAGASIIHVHARNPIDGSPSTEYKIFKEIYDGIKGNTNLIIQLSTGGRAGASYEERSERLKLRPEMASLTTGSVNFPNSVYANSPKLIESLARDMLEMNIKPEMEIFDVSMIQNSVTLESNGLVDSAMHFDFVMGLKGAIPASIENLVHLKNNLPHNATWSVAGIGRAQLSMNTHAILLGGHVRVGLEDNIFLDKGKLARNEELVERIVRIAKELGRDVATADEARKILGLTK